MWNLKNETPYSAERGWFRDINGAEVWVVVVKATYAIASDGSTTPLPPMSVNSGAVMHQDCNELLYDTDLGPGKNATDILLCGNAWAPTDKPVSSLFVGMKVADICRMARVSGRRVWNGQEYSMPEKFTKIPLRYERMERTANNPLGRAIEQAPVENISCLPEIEFLSDASYPGFGAVPRHWSGRLAYAGTYDQHWKDTRSPLLPENFDPRFWQCSPPPQYAAGELRGSEVITLANMTPPGFSSSRILSFAIPKVALNFSTHFTDGSIKMHRAKMHTVIIEPDFPRLSVVWHSALPCHRQVNMLDITTVTEKKRLMLHQPVLPTDFKEWERL